MGVRAWSRTGGCSRSAARSVSRVHSTGSLEAGASGSGTRTIWPRPCPTCPTRTTDGPTARRHKRLLKASGARLVSASLCPRRVGGELGRGWALLGMGGAQLGGPRKSQGSRGPCPWGGSTLSPLRRLEPQGGSGLEPKQEGRGLLFGTGTARGPYMRLKGSQTRTHATQTQYKG